MGKGKKNKGKPKKPLTGLAAALVKSGHLDEKKARKLQGDQRREDKALGRDAVEERERQKKAAAEEQRLAEAEAARQRERARGVQESSERAIRMIKDNQCGNPGSTRWFFVTRSGLVHFLEVDDSTRSLLTDGRAGIVESLGVAQAAHVVVSDRALLNLEGVDPELIRFWNRGTR